MNDPEVVEQFRVLLLQVEHKTTDMFQIKPHLLDIVLRLNARQLYWMCDMFFTAASVGVNPPKPKVEVIDDTPIDDDPEREDTLK